MNFTTNTECEVEFTKEEQDTLKKAAKVFEEGDGTPEEDKLGFKEQEQKNKKIMEYMNDNDIKFKLFKVKRGTVSMVFLILIILIDLISLHSQFIPNVIKQNILIMLDMKCLDFLLIISMFVNILTGIISVKRNCSLWFYDLERFLIVILSILFIFYRLLTISILLASFN